MSLLKFKDIKKMSTKERNEKLAELKLELINIKSSKKTKEIKKAIARLLTFNKTSKEVLKK